MTGQTWSESAGRGPAPPTDGLVEGLGDMQALLDGVVRTQAGAAAARLAVAAGEVDALQSRVRGLPPPSWRGPTADAFLDQLARCAAELGDADHALARAQGAARRLAGS